MTCCGLVFESKAFFVRQLHMCNIHGAMEHSTNFVRLLVV